MPASFLASHMVGCVPAFRPAWVRADQKKGHGPLGTGLLIELLLCQGLKLQTGLSTLAGRQAVSLWEGEWPESQQRLTWVHGVNPGCLLYSWSVQNLHG